MQREENRMRKLSIAIDGPAGAGKSSVAKILARDMGYTYLDTGAMYRAVTYGALSEGITDKDRNMLDALAAGMDMEMVTEEDGLHILMGGKDVTGFLRTPEVSAMVSPIAAVPSVRKALVRLQRKFAAAGGVVLDGRDIGTVVLPNADVKVFLTASAAERARRRFAEISGDRPGATLEEIEKNIILRDMMDSTRSESPLKQADGAVLIDNTGMTLEETAGAIMDLCRKKSEA